MYRPLRRESGFTLIELMITVAVVGILAAIAYPSYQDSVRKSRRADAQAVLMDIGARQQQMLLDTRAYVSSAASLPNFIVPSQVSSYYTITVTAPASTPPNFTATATPTGAQAKDKCGTMTLDNTGAKSPTTCW